MHSLVISIFLYACRSRTLQQSQESEVCYYLNSMYGIRKCFSFHFNSIIVVVELCCNVPVNDISVISNFASTCIFEGLLQNL